MTPLDIHFNVAVKHIASRLFPCGFVVSPDAPDTFDKLKAQFSAGEMIVWSGGSDRTIYADCEVNYCFRAWHDWCHVRGNHPFTPEGERAVYGMQCAHLIEVYGPSLQTRQWCRILAADILGQQEFFYRFGRYPEDQRAFVEAYLDDPFGAFGKTS
jgi:hypothetical protein